MLDAYNVVVHILLVLVNMVPIDSPSRVQQLIECEIIKSPYYAADPYYALSKFNKIVLQNTFTDLASDFLDRISIFLVYDSVLRAYIRSARNLHGPYPRNLRSGNEQSEKLIQSWKNILEKEHELCSLRLVLKERGMCDSKKCPNSYINSAPTSPSIRYLRCTGCSEDWERGHREDCQQRARSNMEGTPDVCERDRKLFELLINGYTNAHSRILTAKMSGDALTQASLRGLGSSRHPILRLKFDGPQIPPPENAEILTTLRGDFPWHYSQFLADLKEKWEGSGLGVVFVWGDFPLNGRGAAYPLVVPIRFPLGI
ncbi:hypothetical protein AAF712_008183 [Marasmius tenuissimus]|uniref:Uncharacterized protein n=1 Tax=Marasmius tenuissimus TaxID=585030 RepID=A0ABR2ZUK4_9AGAR